jgi:hypothetical protein
LSIARALSWLPRKNKEAMKAVVMTSASFSNSR